MKRRAGPLLGAVLLVAVPAIWFVAATGDRTVTDVRGSVTVRTTPSASASAGTPAVDPLLAPPAPPPLPGVIAAAPDAFVGDWRTADGQGLRVNAAGEGRYGVTLDGEQYDGVLRDGRVHFPRGIDGEWLQATPADRCLLLGSGSRFCRAGTAGS